MFAVIAAHLCVAVCAPFLFSRIGRRALALFAVAPLSAVAYALSTTQHVFAAAHSPSVEYPTETLRWIPGLDLILVMRLDVLSWVMTLIVGGVGALVLIYASAYFKKTAAGLGRFAAVFVAFIAAMLGVVQSDHTMGVYAFWEATSLLSYLLIGHHFERRPARTAARQALLVTTSGSLAMFMGFVILGQMEGGSYLLSELVTRAHEGTLGLSITGPTGSVSTSGVLLNVAAFLVLLGAFSKSALVPTHFWLPGAMAAPTPVSAYLHAAAMVKAGLYLVARLTPGFTGILLWSPLIVAAGLVTMFVGGWRALRQNDLKLVLAYGTVSQLGLIMAVLGAGSASLMAAGVTMLLAHSLFKSTLFLTVGAVESASGTRDIQRLSGIGRAMPWTAAAAALAAGSMAGLPLTTGYLGKEALLAALMHGSEARWMARGAADAGVSGAELLVLVLVALGSILTAAYAWRFWWGAFGVRPLDEAITVKPLPITLRLPIYILSLGALLGLAPGALEGILGAYGAPLPGHAHLAWWSGLDVALVTAAIFGCAALLARGARRFEAFQARLAFPLNIVDLHTWTLRELEILAARVTRMTQRGSLPFELSTIMATLVAAVTAALLIRPPSQLQLRVWDSPLQVFIGIVITIAAIMTARARRRMKAAFTLGAVGLGVAVLYASYGAPDLALTQILVEAVGMVIFVLVLRRLPAHFSDRPLARSRWWRLLLSLIVSCGVLVVGLYATAARTHAPDSSLMAEEAYFFGHGRNIVNVILVDIRAWDTVGELSVLLVIATGVASLIHAGSTTKPRYQRILSLLRGRVFRSSEAPAGPHSRVSFLPTVAHLDDRERSIVIEVTTRLLFPTMMILSLWLLFIGHNNPGGGFAGGVVAGLAFVLRYLAGGAEELERAMPISPGRILGTGLFIAGAGAVAPLAFGRSVLQSTEVDWDFGLLGHLHFTTATILDIGVYVLVIGLVLDLVAAAGAQIDRHGEENEQETPEPERIAGIEGCSVPPNAQMSASTEVPR